MTTARDMILEDVDTCRRLIDQGGSREDERRALKALDRVVAELERAWKTADSLERAWEAAEGT